MIKSLVNKTKCEMVKKLPTGYNMPTSQAQSSQRTLTMFVEVVAVRYQHCTMYCVVLTVDSGVPQLRQT